MLLDLDLSNSSVASVDDEAVVDMGFDWFWVVFWVRRNEMEMRFLIPYIYYVRSVQRPHQ